MRCSISGNHWLRIVSCQATGGARHVATSGRPDGVPRSARYGCADLRVHVQARITERIHLDFSGARGDADRPMGSFHRSALCGADLGVSGRQPRFGRGRGPRSWPRPRGDPLATAQGQINFGGRPPQPGPKHPARPHRRRHCTDRTLHRGHGPCGRPRPVYRNVLFLSGAALRRAARGERG